MKKLTRAMTILLAIAIMCAIFSACGGNGGGDDSPDAANSPSLSPDALTWVASFKPLKTDTEYFENGYIHDGWIYMTSTDSVTRTIEVSGTFGTTSTAMSTTSYEDTSYEPVIYKASADGGASEKLENYTPMAIPEGSTGSVSINGLCVEPDGNIWVVESASLYHYDLPADFSEEDDDMWQYYVSDANIYTLRKLDPTGAELSSVDLSELAAESDYFYIQRIVCDSSGNIYFYTSDVKVYVYDNDASPLFTLESTDWMQALITLSDGTVGALSYEGTGFALKPIDVAAKSWGTSIPTDYSYQVYSGGGDYLFFYTANSALYGWNKETKESEKLFNWLDCDINSDNVQALAYLDGGDLLCVNYSYTDSSCDLVTLTQKPASEVAEKTILTYATMSLSQRERAQILQFNKTNDTYRIQVKDYSEYATDDDYYAGLTKLSTEIISGNVPDIIDVSALPVSRYVSKGLLEDLYPYIDADAELDRNGFVESVMNALEIDGGMYQASSSFSILTIMGSADVIGEGMGWTLDEMLACFAAYPDATEPFPQGITRDTMLEYLCYVNMSQFVDWQTGECRFNSQEFIKLLEFCAMFVADYDYNNYESDIARIQSGKQLLMMQSVYDFQSIQMYEAMFGGEITYKGFPSENGNGSVISTDNALAISSTCKYKDAAWSFVRTFLTEEYQDSDSYYIYNFPTNQAAFDKKLEESMKAEYYTDEDGNEVEVSKGGWGWDDLYIEIKATTQQQADQILALIDSVDHTISMDTSITEIIKTEAAAYFAGSKTADETAALIQSRANLYVSEQR